MLFHLEFPIAQFPNKMEYSDKLMFIGSCFAENIGEKFLKAKFNAVINPHGILYDPLSLSASVKSYILNLPVNEKDLFYANECWNSWSHHSKFSHPDKHQCLKNINASISFAHDQLKNVKWLFITFGSAFRYSLKEGNIPVSNCHKIPQREFNKALISAETIIAEYRNLLTKILEMNPGLKVVFTVSPVRYIRDGVVENNLSKSILIQAVHELVKSNENVIYFPAYELVIDDLRDYRFYKDDLVHPNEQAINYVFGKLMNAAYSDSAQSLFHRISEIQNAINHRPFNETSDAHKKFKANYAKRCGEIEMQFPFIDLSEERTFFGK